MMIYLVLKGLKESANRLILDPSLLVSPKQKAQFISCICCWQDSVGVWMESGHSLSLKEFSDDIGLSWSCHPGSANTEKTRAFVPFSNEVSQGLGVEP